MRFIVPLTVACFVVACSPPPPHTETKIETDAGALDTDGGTDAGLPVDAGVSEDAGLIVDAGSRVDAGMDSDAGVDTVAPTVVLNPSQDGVCTSTACTGAFIDAATTSFMISATVTEDVGLAATHPVEARIVDASGAEVVPWTDLVRQLNGSWTWTWTALPDLDLSRLTLEVTATDVAKNRGTASLSVLFDRHSPAVTFYAPNASCTATACTGTVVNALSTALNFTGLISVDATLTMRVLDGAAVISSVAVPQTDGMWSFAWTTFPNVDGRFYSLEFIATDTLFNTYTQRMVVLVDRVNPSLLVSSPLQGTLVGAAQVTVIASAADGLGLKSVEIASSPNGPFVATTLDANGDYVGQVPVPMVDAVEQALMVRATDLADNVRVTSRRYTADRVAPVITVGGADYNCIGQGACTGNVANGASTQVVYGGTVSDGSAVTLRKTLLGPAGVVVASTDAITGNVWSWTWSGLPAGVNGASYVLQVVATDAAGNVAAPVNRFTWLDNVAPTVTFPVAGQRNVASETVLEAFSERMNVSSVNAATTITPALRNAAFVGFDEMHFQVSPLAPYTPYTVALGAAADKAGNTIASASASFLTAPIALSFPLSVFGTIGNQARSPRIVVDSDGRFTVAYSLLTGSNVSTWLTTDFGTATFGMFNFPGPMPTLQVPTDLRITGSSRGADLRLATQLDLTMVSNAGGGSLDNTSISIGWNGA